MAIILPLGVVANQLMKIEADLRLLNMRALDLAKERENERLAGLIEAILENINEALDSIRDLVSEINSHMQPRSTYVENESTQEHDSRSGSSPDVVYSHANRKPHPDRDD